MYLRLSDLEPSKVALMSEIFLQCLSLQERQTSNYGVYRRGLFEIEAFTAVLISAMGVTITRGISNSACV